MVSKFVGRAEEMALLNRLTLKESASLVVIRGRRRIGKSRLIQEFCQGRRALIFSGLPPDRKTTAQSQREEFAIQLSEHLNHPRIVADDWNTLFHYLSQQVLQGEAVLVFDEISWMGSKDPHFLGKLKNAWDMRFSNNPKLMLILCGSVSSWIDRNILSHTGFVGRISLDLKIEELPLKDCKFFWERNSDRISSYEILKVLAVTGGIPKYLEEIIPSQTAEENIQHLCYLPGGILFREFDQIFSDLFGSKAAVLHKC